MEPVQMHIGGDQAGGLLKTLRSHYDGSDIILTLEGNGSLFVGVHPALVVEITTAGTIFEPPPDDPDAREYTTTWDDHRGFGTPPEGNE